MHRRRKRQRFIQRIPFLWPYMHGPFSSKREHSSLVGRDLFYDSWVPFFIYFSKEKQITSIKKVLPFKKKENKKSITRNEFFFFIDQCLPILEWDSKRQTNTYLGYLDLTQKRVSNHVLGR